ncbi:unnamed protein product, partial [Mesorhabditis belari]|uniref:TFIIS N-terminal domain-containing protein n=1 Tax=Mesorhabditis belari TaxID=2138241 RepID=A0AAF3FPP1_9BILA
MDILEAFINSPDETFELDPLPNDWPPVQPTPKTGSLKLNLTRILAEQRDKEDGERVSDDESLVPSSFAGDSPSSVGGENNNEVVSYDDEQEDRDFIRDELDDRACEEDVETGSNRLGASTEKNCIWDFDLMMDRKKEERARKRKHKRDTCDLINDSDGQVHHLVQAMKQAAEADCMSNTRKYPAFQKLKLLPVVKDFLLKVHMMEVLVDNGFMTALAEWLKPLPDQSLPSLGIRTTILKLLEPFRLEQDTIRYSKLGKAVRFLAKHPAETRENKMLAQKLIQDWSRQIFKLPAEFGAMTREERRRLDYDHSAIKRKRRRSMDSDDSPGSSKMSQRSGFGTQLSTSKGYQRASVPKISNTDYVFRPKANDDGDSDSEDDDRAVAARKGTKSALVGGRGMRRTTKY